MRKSIRCQETEKCPISLWVGFLTYAKPAPTRILYFPSNKLQTGEDIDKNINSNHEPVQSPSQTNITPQQSPIKILPPYNDSAAFHCLLGTDKKVLMVLDTSDAIFCSIFFVVIFFVFEGDGLRVIYSTISRTKINADKMVYYLLFYRFFILFQYLSHFLTIYKFRILYLYQQTGCITAFFNSIM